MSKIDESELVGRIEKDVRIFEENIKLVTEAKLTTKELKTVVNLSKMYASDCQSYLQKGDLPTAFSCISYAHGLLDSALLFMGIERYK